MIVIRTESETFELSVHFYGFLGHLKFTILKKNVGDMVGGWKWVSLNFTKFQNFFICVHIWSNFTDVTFITFPTAIALNCL